MRESTRSKLFDPETGAMCKRFQYEHGVQLAEGTFASMDDSQKALLRGKRNRVEALKEVFADRVVAASVVIGALAVANMILR